MFHLCEHAIIRAKCLFRVAIHFICLESSVWLCHEAGLVQEDPLSVDFDHLPGC